MPEKINKVAGILHDFCPKYIFPFFLGGGGALDPPLQTGVVRNESHMQNHAGEIESSMTSVHVTGPELFDIIAIDLLINICRLCLSLLIRDQTCACVRMIWRLRLCGDEVGTAAEHRRWISLLAKRSVHNGRTGRHLHDESTK